MSTTITYQVLFEVRLLHHYFLNRGAQVFDRMDEDEKAAVMALYDAREIFDIEPTEACAHVLESHRCIFKRTTEGFIVGLKSEPDAGQPAKFKPYHVPADDVPFTFYLNPKDPAFLNYSALPVTGNSGKAYIFQNNTTTFPKKFPVLSTFAPAFQNGFEYQPGEMVSDNASNPARLFTAKIKTDRNTSTADWTAEKKSDGFPVAYANGIDRHSLVRGILNYRVKTAGVEPTATVRTAANVLITPRISLLAGDFRTLQVDLRDYPEGFYTMHVQTQDNSYQDDLAFFLIWDKSSPFGIIHLTARSDDNTYDMLDAQGFMRNPAYEIRFRNRATHWRYIGEKFGPSSVTEDPLPLTRFGFIDNVTVQDKDGNAVEDLPNPSVPMIRTESMTSNAEKKFYSEIHIH